MRVQLGPFHVDLDDGTVNGEPCLTRTERRLLAHLLDAEGDVVPRARLLVDVWGYHPRSRTRAVDAAVLRLRKKIEVDARTPVHLLSVRGEGWRLRVPPSEPTSVEGDDAEALLATVPGLETRAAAVAAELDHDPALVRDVLPVLTRHGPEGVGLFAEALRPRFHDEVAQLSVEDRALCRRLTLFLGAFDIEAAQAVARQPVDLARLDRLVDRGALRAEQGAYRLRAVLRLGWRPDLADEDWATLDTWLLDDERSLVGGLGWLQRHALDVLHALDRGVPLTEEVLLLTSDVATLLPAYAERVVRHLEAHGTTPRHRLFALVASTLIGRPASLEIGSDLTAQAQAGDMVACVAGMGMAFWRGWEARVPWVEWLLASKASPRVEARFVPRQAYRMPPASYQRRVRWLREHAHRQGWRGVLDFLHTCDATNDLIYEHFASIVDRPATSTDQLVNRAIAWFGLGEDQRAVEDWSKGKTASPQVQVVGALLHAVVDPHRSRELLSELFREGRPASAHGLAYILQDLLDGHPPTTTDPALEAVLQGTLPAPDLRRPSVIALHLLLRRMDAMAKGI